MLSFTNFVQRYKFFLNSLFIIHNYFISLPRNSIYDLRIDDLKITYLLLTSILKTMAKKRIAKKGLHYLMSDLFTATVIAAADKKADMEKVATTQEKILKVYGDFNSRLSNYERKNAKAFFKQYETELAKEIDSIAEAIDGILK